MSTTESQISRRNLLKKSAAAGAVFWAVPAIESVTSRAAAASVPCQPPGPLQISGAAVVYMRNGVTYWTAFASNGTTCLTPPSVPNDSDFLTPASVCGATVQVTGGAVLYNGNVPQVDSTCYFTATAAGVALTPAGVTAGVMPLVFLFHNGTIPASCMRFGRVLHWGIACGSTNPNCAGLFADCVPPA